MKRSLRSEIVSAVAVLAAPAAIVATFPFAALTFNPTPNLEHKSPAVAFVALSQEEEAAAVRAAKGSWSSLAGGVKSLHAELYFGDLPASENEPALGLSDRPKRQTVFDSTLWPPVFLPSQAAEKPEKIAPEEDPPQEPAFSREELQKIE